MVSLLRLAARAARAAADTTAVALAGVTAAAIAMRIARAEIAAGREANENLAARVLEGADPETRTLFFAVAAVAHQECIGRGLVDPVAPTWSELSPAQQWLLSEQVARIELGQPVAAVGWSEERRAAFEQAARQALARRVVGRVAPARN